jgi:hypothetical protein
MDPCSVASAITRGGWRVRRLYESTQLNFASWMLFNIPGMIINVFFGWLWLQARFFHLR